MRKCPGCDELNEHDSVICAWCGYRDLGWESTLHLARRLRIVRASVASHDAIATVISDTLHPPIGHTIPVTSFTEPGEYAYELSLFDRLAAPLGGAQAAATQLANAAMAGP